MCLGERPPFIEVNALNQLKQNPHKSMIPCKLAFALLVHKVRDLHYAKKNIYIINLYIHVKTFKELLFK